MIINVLLYYYCYFCLSIPSLEIKLYHGRYEWEKNTAGERCGIIHAYSLSLGRLEGNPSPEVKGRLA